MNIFLSCAHICASAPDSERLLSGHHQAVVVTTQGWDEKEGELLLAERKNDDSAWIVVEGPIPVVLGKQGLAWGIGLHQKKVSMPHKVEGDGRAPAGVFSLGHAFGFAPRVEMNHLKVEYLPLHEFIEAVDDPRSAYYNQIVDRREVTLDWLSAEKMGQEPLYVLGLTVHHNFPHPQANAGSAIFLHIWRNSHAGTAGCTAMSLENLSKVLSWLDSEKHPILVQLPTSEYDSLQKEWSLPPLKKASAVSDRALPILDRGGHLE